MIFGVWFKPKTNLFCHCTHPAIILTIPFIVIRFEDSLSKTTQSCLTRWLATSQTLSYKGIKLLDWGDRMGNKEIKVHILFRNEIFVILSHIWHIYYPTIIQIYITYHTTSQKDALGGGKLWPKSSDQGRLHSGHTFHLFQSWTWMALLQISNSVFEIDHLKITPFSATK